MTKHNKKKSPFQSKTLRLADNHTWDAPKGYKILVAERGAVSFNIPQNWVIGKFEPLEVNDKEPPNDNARISMSYWRLPPGIDWSGLPLVRMLSDSIKDDTLDVLERGEVVRSPRTDIELVWIERRFMDSGEHREAFSRNALARGWNVQALVTFDYWADDAPKMVRHWDELLRSLQLGRVIEDPTKGVVMQ